MRQVSRAKVIAVSLLTSLVLVGCGDTNSSTSSMEDTNSENRDIKTSSLHILPIMSDEDGNQSDSQATYTLTANKNVDVTIESS